eukprot:572746-Rhodomonas_salina.1
MQDKTRLADRLRDADRVQRRLQVPSEHTLSPTEHALHPSAVPMPHDVAHARWSALDGMDVGRLLTALAATGPNRRASTASGRALDQLRRLRARNAGVQGVGWLDGRGRRRAGEEAQGHAARAPEGH